MQLSRSIDAVFESWNTAARPHLPPRVPHRRRPGHRGQRRADGVRQHGRRLARPASPSRATRRPASPSCTASSCETPRARTWSPASARPQPLAEMEREMPRGFAAAGRHRCSCSSGTTGRCRTSSSRSSGARCTCCRRAPASAPRGRGAKIARDLVDEGLIDARGGAACGSIAGQLDQLLHPTIDPSSAETTVIAEGLNASPGAAVGAAVFDADTAEARGKDGRGRDPGARGDHARRHPRRGRRRRAC